MSYAHYDQSSPVRGSIIKMTCMESAGGEVGRRKKKKMRWNKNTFNLRFTADAPAHETHLNVCPGIRWAFCLKEQAHVQFQLKSCWIDRQLFSVMHTSQFLKLIFCRIQLELFKILSFAEKKFASTVIL